MRKTSPVTLEHFQRMGIAYLVLLVTLIFTAIAFYRVQENVNAHDQARFDRTVIDMQLSVKRRIARCVDQMYSVRALFAASRSVEMDEWKAFFDTMNVRQSDLGVRTLGYLRKITPEDKEKFLRELNPDTKTNYEIIPPGDRPVYYPAYYTTHFDWRADVIYGLDHGARPERLAGINCSIERNLPGVTARIRTMTAGGFSTNFVTFFYLPVYKKGASIATVEDRYQALDGVIFMTVFPQKMLATISDDESDPGVSFQIFDGHANPDNLFFDTDVDSFSNRPPARPATTPAYTRQVVIPVYNRMWTIVFSSTPAFDATSPRYLQWLALDGGLAMSLLLFGIAWTQAKARARAEADEAEIAIEKEELAVTLYSIGDGVITTDTEARIVSINKVAQSLTGWAQKDAIGKPLGEVFRLVYEESHKPAVAPVDTVLKTGEIVELGNHIALIARDGSERSIADSAAPIRNQTGEVIGVVLVFRDVTEKQKLEAQMLKESKLESVGLLAGGIAHDFNNMLTCMAGNISLARMDGVSAEQRIQLLVAAENAVMRAKDLTQQLLTFARGGEPIKKPMHIDGLIREACEFALRGSNVQCQFCWNDGIWPVELDEGQFRQVLNNLVINARQAMPDGGRVDVWMENVHVAGGEIPPLSHGNYVRISIRDHGMGIKPELLSKIFEPYFTTKKGGSGLGLATVYSVIRKHDGLVKVDSKVGEGSTFHIYLMASNKPVAPVASKPLGEVVVKGGRLLIMDDDTSVLKILGAILRKVGFEVETAAEGTEAIKRYADAKTAGKPFDVVIMDLTIPNGVGGREAIKRMKEIDPAVKAIVSSGYSLDPVMANYRKDGFVGIIPKPYRTEELLHMVQEVLAGRAS